MYAFKAPLEIGEVHIEAQVLELEAHGDLGALFESYYKETEPSERLRASAVIVRPPVEQPIKPAVYESNETPLPMVSKKLLPLGEQFDIRENTFSRLGVTPVHLLVSWQYMIYLSENINPNAQYSPIEEVRTKIPTLIHSLQEEELDQLVSLSQARLPDAPGIVYRAPSGKLVRSFLRVGNIQHNRSAIDAVFFWLIPHLRGCIGIVTDTWSISSISLNASRRLQVYRGGDSPPCSVEMLPRYHDGSESRAAESIEVVEKLFANTRIGSGAVLFLISATQSGSLVAHLRKSLAFRGFPRENAHFVAIFKLGTAPMPKELTALRDLTGVKGFETHDPIEESESSQLESITIDDRVYFPLTFKDVVLGLKSTKETESVRKFFTDYGGADLVRVHRDVNDDGSARHHAIWIDTEALTNHPSFEHRFAQRLLALQPSPDVVITPRHRVALKLGELACDILAKVSRPRHIAHPNLFIAAPPRPSDEETAKVIDRVPKQSAILILDDAYITGARLSSYQAHLRYRTFQGKMHYMVALARPWSLADWKKFCRRLGYRRKEGKKRPDPHTVQAIETLVLPHWQEHRCPWCREMEIYRKSGKESEIASRRTIAKRLEQLQRAKAEGLSKDLFLGVDGHPDLEIRKESIFVEAPASQASVFAAVASALQSLRVESPKQSAPVLGPRRYPLSTVLYYKEYLVHTYTDSILRASILRAAVRDELVYADKCAEREKGRRVRELIMSDIRSRANLAAELGLAIADRKFPEVADSGEIARRLNELNVAHVLKSD